MKTLLALLMIPALGLAQAPPATRLTTIHAFQGAGRSLPVGGLVEGEDGVYYGVTADGGASGGGTVYKVTTAGAHAVLHEFGRAPNNETGEMPRSGLVRGADGSLYGTAALGGPSDQNSNGVVYRITPAGVLTVLHAFSEADGFSPGEIMMASDGNLYGTTLSGGADGGGTIYRLTTGGAYTVLHHFAGDATEGGFDFSRLVEGPGMTLYGTAQRGGYIEPGIEGTFFSVTSTGTFDVRHRFLSTNGDPTGVIFGNDGLLYGTGFGGDGFRITTAGDIAYLHKLFTCSCGTEMGGQPAGRLVQAANGLFYGATSGGGITNNGTLYSMNSTGTVVPLHSFNGTTDGIAPNATLIEGRDGRLYGTTSGFNTPGTVFKFAFAPVTPANFVASATSTNGTASGEVRLTWDAVRSANSYEVYRGTASGNLNQLSIGSVLTANSYVATGLTPGVTYYFAVVAVNEAGPSPRSAEASAVPFGFVPEEQPRAGGGGGGGWLDVLSLVMLLALLQWRAHAQRQRVAR
ncbi:MAG TPA: choice-of-anchor tandem repeat GloVer-containing protein [Steroidobacteraceae bacterium]|nr:choice-of-anchor tandem repeat GloVer-containing protein [Steroidobacteraceae bacterium]